MNCREFLIEFEERGNLSEPAILHLTICADCKKMSESQSQIWRMIDRFVPVNAPTDFDFRVKARIANARPTDFQPRFLPVLRYILPIGIVVALVGLIAFNTSYFSGNRLNDVSVAKSTEASNIQSAATNTNSDNQVAVASNTADGSLPVQMPKENSQPFEFKRIPRDETAELLPNQTRKYPKQKSDNDPGSGSRISSVSGTTTFTPKGINLNSNSTANSGVGTPKSTDEAQILSFNGIETILENGKRTVKSLKRNETGERSGVKVGDVIEKVGGDSITVMRGTEKIEIKFQRTINQPQ